jgi:hypothetical protein
MLKDVAYQIRTPRVLERHGPLGGPSTYFSWAARSATARASPRSQRHLARLPRDPSSQHHRHQHGQERLSHGLSFRKRSTGAASRRVLSLSQADQAGSTSAATWRATPASPEPDEHVGRHPEHAAHGEQRVRAAGRVATTNRFDDASLEQVVRRLRGARASRAGGPRVHGRARRSGVPGFAVVLRVHGESGARRAGPRHRRGDRAIRRRRPHLHGLPHPPGGRHVRGDVRGAVRLHHRQPGQLHHHGPHAGRDGLRLGRDQRERLERSQDGRARREHRRSEGDPEPRSPGTSSPAAGPWSWSRRPSGTWSTS